jgi:hypothetical protein
MIRPGFALLVSIATEECVKQSKGIELIRFAPVMSNSVLQSKLASISHFDLYD